MLASASSLGSSLEIIGELSARMRDQISDRFLAQRESERALATLSEIRHATETSTNDLDKSYAMFLIASRFGTLGKKTDAFDVARAAIQATNSSYSSVAKSLSPLLEFDAKPIEQAFRQLAGFDFVQALAETQKLTDPEVSMLAQGVVCETALLDRSLDQKRRGQQN